MSKTIPIKPETLTGFADQARRLGNVEGELTTAQMQEIFAGVTAGGGSVLPENVVICYRIPVETEIAVNAEKINFETSITLQLTE